MIKLSIYERQLENGRESMAARYEMGCIASSAASIPDILWFARATTQPVFALTFVPIRPRRYHEGVA